MARHNSRGLSFSLNFNFGKEKNIMSIVEKTAYLKGLADGLEIDKSTKEGKLISALIDLVDEMAKNIEDIEMDIDELYEYAEELDEDLGDVEEVLLDDEDDYYDDDECCDGNCCDCDLDCDDCDGEEYYDDTDYFEITCPACGDVVNFDDSIDPENLRCPACGEKFSCIVEEDDLAAIDGEEA